MPSVLPLIPRSVIHLARGNPARRILAFPYEAYSAIHCIRGEIYEAATRLNSRSLTLVTNMSSASSSRPPMTPGTSARSIRHDIDLRVTFTCENSNKHESPVIWVVKPVRWVSRPNRDTTMTPFKAISRVSEDSDPQRICVSHFLA